MYDDDEMLQLQGIMYAVNQAAFPKFPCDLISSQKRSAADNGELDIITGVTRDTNFRLIILEGLGQGGMKNLHKEITRAKDANGPRCRAVRSCCALSRKTLEPLI